MLHMKVFKCADLGFKCDWVAKAQNENELMKLIKDHAKKCHHLNEISKETIEKVKSVILTQ